MKDRGLVRPAIVRPSISEQRILSIFAGGHMSEHLIQSRNPNAVETLSRRTSKNIT